MTVRVLLVDDHQLMREGLRRILEATSDIEVAGEASDGRTALEAAARLQPDVVVMDVAMSEMNGIEATRCLLREHPRMRVVALSTHADKRYVRNMLQAGAVGYVLKEAASADLLRAVHAAARGEHYLSPRITGCVVETLSGAPPTPDEDSPYRLLGPREREVLKHLAEGRTSKEIARRLGISLKTIETHRRNIAHKVGERSIAGLTKYAVREGLTDLG